MPGDYKPPVVIGGVGGSGTRLIAQCLGELGFFLGHDLNDAMDNLWFTLLFKRAGILSSPEDEFNERVEIFLRGMTGRGEFTGKQLGLINDLAALGWTKYSLSRLKEVVHTLRSGEREQHPVKWLRKRGRTLLAGWPEMDSNAAWGWKEPNSHIVLDRLKNYFPDMKYIHLVRNGLDMAHSGNQNQLEFWGQDFIDDKFDLSPYYSLKYWCIIHRRVLEIGKSMGTSFLFLNYDDFCSNPDAGIATLCGFLDMDPGGIQKERLLGLVSPPGSVGRFKQYGTGIFAAEDVAFVGELGFDIGEDVCENPNERSE